MNKLSAISFLLHKMLQTYGYADIYDGGDTYRIVYMQTNPAFVLARPLKEEQKVCENLYDAMAAALEVTRSVEECQISCGPIFGGEWFFCSHSGLDADEEIVDSYVTEFSEEVSKEYDACTAEGSLHEALEFLRHGEGGNDWYDLWNEGSFADAAKGWPEAPISANYFADTQMFCTGR